MSSGESSKDGSVAARGLKGVVAADTSICFIDGQTGKLLYRGYSIDDLARKSSFEEVTYLLLKGDLPNRAEFESLKAHSAEGRRIPPPVLTFLRRLPSNALPMAALRTALSIAGIYDPASEDTNPQQNLERAFRLTSLTASVVAAIHRLRTGQEPLEPRADLCHAGNFLYQLTGRTPSPDETEAMDLILTLHAEHGLNASTFAARVIAATLTDMYSAVTGAIGALKGPLHGGANTEVLKTLMELGDISRVPAWVEEMRARKGIFMGFGHAVYSVSDPRAGYLKDLSRRLGIEKGEPKWYEMSVLIEELVTKAINKHCNVDFYSASLQYYMGIPGDLFTCVFAASRIAGWCAHILEQWANNKIIRPSSNYVGHEERPYVPIEERG
jgi:citrate synthase